MVVENAAVNSPSSQKLKPSTIRIGTRYRANRLKGPYDAIVIGSGIGGLTTAACLAKAGKKGIVLEQHYTAGGYTHS
jgi:all-trans-retinol 13,14-reductase